MTVDPNNYGGNRIGNNLPQLLDFHKTVNQWSNSVDNFTKTIKILTEDTYKSVRSYHRKPNDQSIRRQLIKNMFAWFEGQVFLMKRIALARYNTFKIDFSNADIAILREDKYMLSEKGEAHSNSSNYQKFAPNYLFAFRCFLKAHGTTFILDQQKVSDLKNLEQVRNRLTHPKTFEDLEVTDNEIKLAETVFNHHSEQTIQALDAEKEEGLLEERNFVLGIGNSLKATLPILLIMWKTGEVFEFPNRRKAKDFALATSGMTSIDFTITSATENPNSSQPTTH